MQAPLLGLIDYGSGNLRSVSKALDKIGARVERLDAPDRLEEMDAIVLPGVGAFGDCAEQLRQRGLWNPIADWLRAERPFLGHMPRLPTPLRVQRGNARRGGFRAVRRGGAAIQRARPEGAADRLERAPFYPSRRAALARLGGRIEHVYFVHSYYPQPTEPDAIAATADYGGPFAAAVEQGQTMGVQFHPEKSQDAGLAMLRNFAAGVARR